MPIGSIKLPDKQPRRSFDAGKMEQLVESVGKYGVLEPLILRPLSSNTYELVAGERRLRAAKTVGLTEVPVVIKALSDRDAFELALLENLQRDDLNPIDETEGILDLLCQSLDLERNAIISLLNKAANAERKESQITDIVIRNQVDEIDKVFMTVGRLNRESFRSNRLPLLNLPPDVLAFLREGTLEYTKAKAIAKLESKLARKKLMKETTKDNLSLREVKHRVAALIEDKSPKITAETALKKDFKAICQVKTSAWQDEAKQEKLKTLLDEIRAVLTEE